MELAERFKKRAKASRAGECKIGLDVLETKTPQNDRPVLNGTRNLLLPKAATAGLEKLNDEAPPPVGGQGDLPPNQ